MHILDSFPGAWYADSKEKVRKGEREMPKKISLYKEKIRAGLPAAALLLCAAILFCLFSAWAAPAPHGGAEDAEPAHYERCKVQQILVDNTTQAEADDGGWRGDQLMLVQVMTGEHAGETLQVYNYVGPLYGAPLREGDTAVVTISTYLDGSYVGTIFEYDRLVPLAIVVILFLAAAILVGGKTGAKSLVGLLFTLLCLFKLLIPALLKGAPTLLTVFLVCAYIAVVSLTVLGGLQKKTLCAMAGTVTGVLLAMLFGLLAQHMTRIDGLRLDDVEPLLQLRQAGENIGLRGLLVGGVIISALGAVMDVTMGISSSLWELHSTNPDLDGKQLFRSGMNIGRDMVGTMTNTLILAFLGSAFTLILYLYSLDLETNQLLSSAFVSIEVISGVSSSIGVILSIPITAGICAMALPGRKKS